MVHIYSLPKQITSPQGGSGVYTCGGGKSGGAYAQCDGGFCFRSTVETTRQPEAERESDGLDDGRCARTDLAFE